MAFFVCASAYSQVKFHLQTCRGEGGGICFTCADTLLHSPEGMVTAGCFINDDTPGLFKSPLYPGCDSWESFYHPPLKAEQQSF